MNAKKRKTKTQNKTQKKYEQETNNYFSFEATSAFDQT